MIDLKGKTIKFNSSMTFEELEDDRISKVRLKMCHDGINANNSEILFNVLQRDIEKSINESTIGVPILADFKDYDFDTHTSDERAIGSIVKDYAEIEFIYDEKYDRTFSWATGYIWNYYSQNAMEILEEDNERAVSIEIQVLDGEYDKDRKVYTILEFILNGITILGKKVPEGMTGSRIFLDYSVDDLTSTLQEVFSNNKHSEENECKDNSKESEIKMAFNKKEHALKFGLTTMQLAEEFAKACYSIKYYEEWCGENYECSKYGFRDYDDTYVYAMDYENGYMIGAKYSFQGDMPIVDFENSIRMKCAYEPFDMGGAQDPENPDDPDCVIEDDDMMDYSAKEIKECKKNNFELESKIKELNSKIAEFEANPVIDRTEEVKALEIKVAEFTKEIEINKQTIIDLGLKFTSLEQEKQLVDEKLNKVENDLANYATQEAISKAKELFNRVSAGLSKEENDSLTKEMEEIKDNESYEKFEAKIKDLAFARFSSLATNKEVSNNFHRTPVVKTEETDEKPKDIWEKWRVEK